MPPPAGWPAGWAWDQADLRDWPGWAGHEIVVGCLCLHHFQQECLAGIGSRWQQTARLVILAEPVRRRYHQWQGSLLALLGANHVTRHDLRASVQAGFRHDELATFLGLDRSAWTINITERFLGSYRLVARRR